MDATELRHRRDQLGLTQAQLAALLGLSVRMVKMLERGRRTNGQPLAIQPAYALAMEAIEARARRGALIVPPAAELPRD